MNWTWQKTEEIFEGFGPITREIASNDKGVSIEPWGAYGAHRQILFKYNDKDIAIEFAARRSPRSVAEHGEINVSGADFPLGPICEVWIDDRRMEFGVRPLSAGEKATIKETITDFLTTVFRDCSYAVPPYAEQVEFL